MMSAKRYWPVALLALIVTGCGSGTAQVEGNVTFDGKPMPGGSVVLYCGDGQIVRGLISADGHYAIPNVPRGPAKIAVQSHARVPQGLRLSQQVPPAVNGPIHPSSVDNALGDRVVTIPARYSVPEESGLSLVVDGKGTTFDIHLTR